MLSARPKFFIRTIGCQMNFFDSSIYRKVLREYGFEETPDMKKALVEMFKEFNVEYQPNEVMVSCGGKHTIYNFFMAVLNKGDEVLIPKPYWVSYPQMVTCSGATSVFIPTSAETNFRVTPQQLAQYSTDKTKLLILNSPSNPTGSLYSREELEAIAEFCVKNKIYVISDEIYEKLIYGSDKYTSIASLDKVQDRGFCVRAPASRR